MRSPNNPVMPLNWSYTTDELAAILDVTAPPEAVRISGASTDTRTLQPGDVFFALQGERFDGNRFAWQAFEKGAAAAVVTQSEALAPAELGELGPVLAVEDTLAALQAFAGAHRRRYAIPILAITGSCGKTTAKDLTAAVLGSRYNIIKTHGNLNNEIGCPLSLLQLDAGTEFAVFEMGANHPGEIARLSALVQPSEAVITMIAPAHLEGFGSIEAVAQAKAEILEGLPPDGVFYVNEDDLRCRAIGDAFPGKRVRFGRSAKDVRLESCTRTESGELHVRIEPVGELMLPLPSRALLTNVLLAVAAGVRHGIEDIETPLREACRTLTRIKVETAGPIAIIDDSYNANPASTAAALEMLAEFPGKGMRVAALGDMLELGAEAAGWHRAMGRAAGELGISRVYAMGEHAADVVAGARDANGEADVAESHEAIADAVWDAADAGTVLLVKGSRGMQMERIIEALRAKAGASG